MSKLKSNNHRREEVANKAKQPNHMYGYCRVIGCGKPARAGTDDGLDMKYCRAHAEHNQRHGSPLKTSYSAKELNPYRQAALAWIIRGGSGCSDSLAAELRWSLVIHYAA